MRVCIAARFVGGVGVYSRTLVRALAETVPDLRLEVVTPDPVAAKPNYIGCAALHLIRHTAALPTHPGWIVQAAAFRLALRPLLGRIDLVHFPSDARHALFALGLPVPVVATMNDYFNAVLDWRPGSTRRYYHDWPARYPLYQLARLGERRALRRLSHIIGISDAVGQIVGPAYGIPPDRFTTVRYGIDFPVIPPNDGAIRSPRTVLFVGGNFQRKGLLVLLRAAPAVLARFPDTRFLIIGKSSYARECQRFAQSLGVGAACDFLGGVEYGRLLRYYASATVLAMPSLMEAFGIPYLEAMSCGLPAVATSCAGPDEYLADGENALVVPPGDADALADALVRLLGDVALRERLRRGGRETARAFTPARMAQETLAVYARVLSGASCLADVGGGVG